MKRNKRIKRLKWFFFVLLIVSILLSIFFVNRVKYTSPTNIASSISSKDLIKVSDAFYTLNNSWLRLNENGNWECYIEGNGYDRGRTLGLLQQELGRIQEEVFIKEIESKIPSKIKRQLITLGIAWFNRDLDMYIPEEYRKEIYGISQFFSDEFDSIGPKYNRIINYHAAHDIGHAVQNMHIVACTAFGKWDYDSTMQEMLIGRNFDFYFGDDFAKNKIILLSNPDSGYQSISVTWPSFIGVVSGLNEKGLGITLNSDKSAIPSESGTPVSIIARDVLQYASTIDEAFEICKKYKSFVSESFTISSAIDKKVVVIEKTPDVTSIYQSSNNSIVVTNHFQSEELKNSPLNIEHKNTSESLRRYDRTFELLSKLDSANYMDFAGILRDQKGIGSEDIGMGNPMAINQLLAHHSVIFDNVNQFIWVSDYPFQINKMEAYSLRNFSTWKSDLVSFPITIDSLKIEADPFLSSSNFIKFEQYKEIRDLISNATSESSSLNESLIDEFVSTNPSFYETYFIIANYYLAQENNDKAIKFYEIALTKEIAYQEDKIFIENKISEIRSDD